LTTLASAILHK